MVIEKKSESRDVAHIEAGALAGLRVPTRADTHAGAGGIKAQTGYHQEHMTTLGVHGKPLTIAGLTPAEKLTAGAVLNTPHHTGLSEHETYGTGAIVPGIHVSTMPTTTAVRAMHNLVTGGNELFDTLGRFGRRHSLVPAHIRGVAFHIHVGGRGGILLQLVLLLAPGQGYQHNSEHECC